MSEEVQELIQKLDSLEEGFRQNRLMTATLAKTAKACLSKAKLTDRLTEARCDLDATIMEAIKAGTTTLGDYDLYMDNVCAFIDKVGARGNIAQTIRGIVPKIYAPGELYEMDDMLAEEMIARNLSLYDKWNQQAEGRIRILFGPQGADFLSLDKLKKVQAIAKERKTKLHMHVQQGERETFQITKRYGNRPVQLLESLG